MQYELKWMGEHLISRIQALPEFLSEFGLFDGAFVGDHDHLVVSISRDELLPLVLKVRLVLAVELIFNHEVAVFGDDALHHIGQDLHQIVGVGGVSHFLSVLLRRLLVKWNRLRFYDWCCRCILRH